MNKVDYVKVLLGQLIKQTRTLSMDQEELALRTGTSKNTISRLERGSSINSETLLRVMHQLDILAPFIETLEQEYELVSKNPLRKSSQSQTELPNDF